MSKMSTVATLKIIFDRGRNYASIVQFLLVIFIAVKELQSTNIGSLIPRTAIAAPIGLVIALGGIMFLGYLDYKFLYGHEQERASYKNPTVTEMLDRLERIEKKHPAMEDVRSRLDRIEKLLNARKR